MLVSILAIVSLNYQLTNAITFSYNDILQVNFGEKTNILLMLGFFIAFAVKMPVVPLHSWLPDTHSQAPTGGSINLAGILLKTACYGLIRFNI